MIQILTLVQVRIPQEHSFPRIFTCTLHPKAHTGCGATSVESQISRHRRPVPLCMGIGAKGVQSRAQYFLGFSCKIPNQFVFEVMGLIIKLELLLWGEYGPGPVSLTRKNALNPTPATTDIPLDHHSPRSEMRKLFLKTKTN